MKQNAERIGSILYPQSFELGESEVRAPKCSFLAELPSGVLLQGTPTVVQIGGSDLTIGTPTLNTVEVEVNGITHAIGTVVQVAVSTPKAGQTYRVRVRAETDGTPTEYPVRIFEVVGVADGT